MSLLTLKPGIVLSRPASDSANTVEDQRCGTCPELPKGRTATVRGGCFGNTRCRAQQNNAHSPLGRELTEDFKEVDAADTTRFVIYPSPNAGKSPNTCMGFATDDIEAEVRDLRARGVVFEDYDYPTLKTVEGIATVGPTRSAWFRDSEGNIIGVVQLPPA